jgi:GTP pyrophosphokinase
LLYRQNSELRDGVSFVSPLSDVQQNAHQWLQSLVKMQTQTVDAVELLEQIKIDLFPDVVFVFTPKGKIISLPRGACPVDFAYSIHTDIGNRCIACKVNHQLSSLQTLLKSGDVIEVMTAPNTYPSSQWLKFVKTGKARSEIRHVLKQLEQDQLAMIAASPVLNADLSVVRMNADHISLISTNESMSQSASLPLVVNHSQSIYLNLSTCCMPIPDDALLAIAKPNVGYDIHVETCIVVQQQLKRNPNGVSFALWDASISGVFKTSMDVFVRNRIGILADITVCIAEAESNLVSVVALNDEGEGELLTIRLVLEVRDRQHLSKIFKSVRRIADVLKIIRTVKLQLDYSPT